jgi:L-ascorbate metabolism protein UlaG (beta-lactamase superfamily)
VDKSIEALKTLALAHLRWFGQSSFRLHTDAGQVAFIDPFRVPGRAGPG